MEVEVQYATNGQDVPSRKDFERWSKAVLVGRRSAAQMTIRIVGCRESECLNSAYRGKAWPTNVLSFPVELPAEVDIPLLGDVVICSPVVAREAREQGKNLNAHWAHMVVHGILHLLGYDHQTEEDALAMENLETQILANLGYPDPYQE